MSLPYHGAVRAAEFPRDWESVLHIENLCFPLGAFSRKDYEAELEDGAWCLVAEQIPGAHVVGCIWVSRDEVISLGVRPGFRRFGHADALLREALARIDRDHPEAWLNVRPAAISALRLYIRHGFEPDAWDPSYYGARDGAIHMTKQLHRPY